MNTAKLLTSASVVAASVLSFAGIAAASGFNAGAHTYVNESGQTVTVGGGRYFKSDGTTATFGHARGVKGSSRYIYGSGTCTRGVSCTYKGSGAGEKGSYNTTANAVNNGNGTWTANATVNYTNTGGVLQTKTWTKTINR
jgi:hypothetical protein